MANIGEDCHHGPQVSTSSQRQHACLLVGYKKVTQEPNFRTACQSSGSKAMHIPSGANDNTTCCRKVKWYCGYPVALFLSGSLLELPNKCRISNTIYPIFSFTIGGLLESLCCESQINYACDFCIADQAIANGRVAATAHERENVWSKWCGYVQEFENVDPYLANEIFEEIVRAVTGFGGWVRTGGGHVWPDTCLLM